MIRVKDHSKVIIDDQIDLASCKKRLDVAEPEKNTKYELYGVIHHQGSLHSGHYSW